LSLGLGVLAIFPIVQSENGYVAGFAYIAILFFIASVSLLTGIVGLIMLALRKQAGPFLLIVALLIPVGFFGSAVAAKFFELGSYREEPMVSLLPEVSNVVIFKKGVSPEEIDRFWGQTLSSEREDGRGRGHLPGIRVMGSLPLQNTHEAMEFQFFDNATEEQRAYVYSRVSTSVIVEELRKEVSMNEYRLNPVRSVNPNADSLKKATNINH
jgi:hypothetical protein